MISHDGTCFLSMVHFASNSVSRTVWNPRSKHGCWPCCSLASSWINDTQKSCTANCTMTLYSHACPSCIITNGSDTKKWVHASSFGCWEMTGWRIFSVWHECCTTQTELSHWWDSATKHKFSTRCSTCTVNTQVGRKGTDCTEVWKNSVRKVFKKRRWRRHYIRPI